MTDAEKIKAARAVLEEALTWAGTARNVDTIVSGAERALRILKGEPEPYARCG